MGNVCCTDRRLLKPAIVQAKAPSALKSTKRVKSSIPSSSKSPRLSFLTNLGTGKVSQVSPLTSPIIESNPDSLIEELEYDLSEASELTLTERQSILKIFSMYHNEIPEGEQEIFEGFCVLGVKESENSVEERAALISNFAIYVLKKDDLEYVFRRIRLENLQVIILDAEGEAAIIHMVENELAGDLWVKGACVVDLHNCVQTMFRYLCQRYIPTYSFSGSSFSQKFNRIPQVLIQTLLEDENLKANNVIIQQGKLGENLLCNQASKTVMNNEVVDVNIVLTSKALYTLSEDFRFHFRLDLKLIKSLALAENVDKVVIQRSNNEKLLFFVNSKFVTQLEKAANSLRDTRLPISHKENVDVGSFLQ